MRLKSVWKTGVSLMLCLCMLAGFQFVGSYQVFAKTAAELNSDIAALEQKSKEYEQQIKELKAQKADQAEIQKALQAQVDNTQAQIALCTSKISAYKEEIAKNEALINEKTLEMEEYKYQYRQRLRAIAMSNTGSSLEVLLSAESLADFLAKTQFVQNVSARDAMLIEDIKTTMKEIEAAKADIEEKSAAQTALKKTLSEKRSQLQAQMDEVNQGIAELNATQNSIDAKNDDLEAQIKAMQNELASISNTSNIVYDGSQFTWPVPGIYRITSGFGGRWGGQHLGIDISGGGIMGHPIVAAADGVILVSKNGCTHNYGKSGSCGCGGGYGNYVMIDHGNYQGATYRTLYGHMTSTAVSVGQSVKKGQVIGYAGSTGWSTGAHLHFEVIVNGVKKNPMNYFNKVQ